MIQGFGEEARRIPIYGRVDNIKMYVRETE
jgi:hypothetical protein